ncbi:outer membrane beta-barrel protein [Acidovorax sp. SUPP2522]|uniref:outer membrane beta-barrel protein n=1 Tax=unclassified Acidovorax TaxID=2684926 RepID=UPI00234B6E50|nr:MULTISPECIES: outer membrane beta-barrel protein [unclassified Acidovorax]WCM96425.1 outer membrane beta-barrel protein [Acidovorax sp. GBBC 1281]GKT15027.1 outer membrane beta-barrel protein [Acidovorax sp. SUPP2522]
MKHTLRVLPCVLALAFGAVTAHAQTANRASNRDSFIPSTQQGYVGLSGGQSKYDLRSGTGGFAFDDNDTAWKIYTGGYFNQNFGIEFGYLNFGNATRVGGETKAQGLNLSLVGHLPLSEQFDVFGKVGTTYGRTKTSGNPGFGVTTGDDNGFGLSYGAGVRWAFNPQWAAVVEWERHRLNFADGKSDVDMTTVGVQYRY